MLVYDIEIVKAVPQRDKELIDGIEYCDGWHDHENMGVSIIGVYDFLTGQSRVFAEDNFDEFFSLIEERNILAGFNNIPFDNQVLAHIGPRIPESKCYDLLRQTWAAAGLGPKFVYPSHAGYSLGAIAVANGLPDKTGHGAFAPVDWQRGNIGAVVDYCLHDVWLTRKLLEVTMAGLPLINPKNNEELVLLSPNQHQVMQDCAQTTVKEA